MKKNSSVDDNWWAEFIDDILYDPDAAQSEAPATSFTPVITKDEPVVEATSPATPFADPSAEDQALPDVFSKDSSASANPFLSDSLPTLPVSNEPDLKSSYEPSYFFDESELPDLEDALNKYFGETGKAGESPATAAVSTSEDNSEKIGTSELDGLDLQASWPQQVEPEKIEVPSPPPLPEIIATNEISETFVVDTSATPFKSQRPKSEPTFMPVVPAPIPAPKIAVTSTQTEKRPEIGIINVIKQEGQNSSRRKSILVALFALICVLAAAYYLLYGKTKPPQQKPVTTTTPKSGDVPKPAVAETPAKSIQPRLSSARRAAVLPSFVPAAGRDFSFRFKEPGWERYVDKLREYRLYRDEAGIRALQVLAIGEEPVGQDLIRTILKELTTSADYTILSKKEEQAGFTVTQGIAGSNADVLIYRKKGAIRGLVILLKK